MLLATYHGQTLNITELPSLIQTISNRQLMYLQQISIYRYLLFASVSSFALFSCHFFFIGRKKNLFKELCLDQWIWGFRWSKLSIWSRLLSTSLVFYFTCLRWVSCLSLLFFFFLLQKLNVFRFAPSLPNIFFDVSFVTSLRMCVKRPDSYEIRSDSITCYGRLCLHWRENK